jgi:branched-chain amino acid transport system ATP-binding protein
MKMVMRVSSHIVVLDHGEKLVEGRPEVVREDPRVIAAYLGVAEGTEEVAHALH